MKITVITQNDIIFLPYVISLINKYTKISTLVVLSPFIHKSNIISSIKKRLQVYGLIYVLKVSVLYSKLFFWSLMPKFSRKTSYSLRNFCSDNRVPFRYFNDVNSPDFESFLNEQKPDLLVSISAPQKFGKDILDFPKYGCINLHGSLLPKHRGLQPSFWTLYYDDKETGSTVHYMGENIDDGAIIEQARIYVHKKDTQFDIIKKTKFLGSKLLIIAIKKISSGTSQTIKIDKDKGNYNSFPEDYHVTHFFKNKKRLL